MAANPFPPNVARWFKERTFTDPATASEAAALKRSAGDRVAVVLPALNEASTIGAICTAIASRLMDQHGLVDELLVVDSGSEDDTIDVARTAGATVHRAADILEDRFEWGPQLGKGETLWRSLAVMSAEIVVWLDSDNKAFDERFVVDLVTPLLRHPEIALCKGFYDRPIEDGTGGARVTELLVRPVLNALYPELAGMIQPLSGEYAMRTQVARELPFFTGYGVEIGLLFDVVERRGLNALAQSDLGVRFHRNRDVLALGRTAQQVLHVMLRRLEDLGRIKIPDEIATELIQFVTRSEGVAIQAYKAEVLERPPLDELLN